MGKRAAVTKTPTDEPVAQVRGEVEQLNGQELAIAVLYRQKAAELARVRSKRGDQVLAAADPAGAARESSRRVSAMLEEMESLTDASKRARELRIAAIPAVFRAQADDAARQAEQLEADAALLEKESDRLRKALEAHDDCTYSPTPPVVPERFAGHPQGGAPVVVYVVSPRHERMRLAAKDKRSEAARTRVQEPHRAGSVDADNFDDLLAAVFASCTCATCRGFAGMRVTPTIDAISEWAEQAIDALRRRAARNAFGYGRLSPDSPLTYHLEWREGNVDATGSRVLTPAPHEVRSNANSRLPSNMPPT
jgi:hypothetical protein